MAENGCSSTRPTTGLAVSARVVAELVDALVEAVDLGRWTEIDRLRTALAPLGAVELFDAELRLNGIALADGFCLCAGPDVW